MRSRLARIGRALLIGAALGSGGARSPSTNDRNAALAALDLRGRAQLTAAEPNLFPIDDVKFRAYDTLAVTALHGCGAPNLAQRMADILDPTKIAKSVDGAALAFVLPPLVRYMRLYPQCLSRAQVARIRAYLVQPQPLFTHGTLNHALMTATSYYLLAEMFPDQAWHEGRGAPFTSTQVIARYRALLLGRFAATMAHGHNEQLSPTYAPVDLYPLLNLIDFARDPALRRAAEVVLVAGIAMLRADSIEGAIVPPYTREPATAGQVTGWPRTNAGDMLWYYYGSGAPPHPPLGPAAIAMFATSRWRPPAALLGFKPADSMPYEVRTRTPAFSEWAASGATEAIGSALLTRDFAIGSGEFVRAVGHDKEDGAVAFGILPVAKPGVRPIECLASPAFRASPRQQAFRYGAQGVLVYAPRTRFGCVYDEHADGYSETHRKPFAAAPDTLVLRYARIVVAIRSLRYGSPPIPGRPLYPAIVYRVTVLPSASDFDAFAKAVEAQPIVQDEATGAVHVTTDDGHRLSVRYTPPVAVAGRTASRADVRIDGIASPESSPLIFDSPVFRMGNGRFVLTGSAGSLRGSVIGETATLTR